MLMWVRILFLRVAALQEGNFAFIMFVGDYTVSTVKPHSNQALTHLLDNGVRGMSHLPIFIGLQSIKNLMNFL